MPVDEPEPQRHTGHLIRRAQQRHLALWQEHVSADVSSVQYAALTILERSPGASQSDLGAELDLDRSTIADLVARMERHGLIERLPHPSDRRRYALSLTDAGSAETRRLRPLVHVVNTTLTQGMSMEERTTLRALLQLVVTPNPRPMLTADRRRTRRRSAQSAGGQDVAQRGPGCRPIGDA